MDEQHLTLTLTLSAGQIGYLRQLLGQRPHDEVRPIIAAIEGQIAKQALAGVAAQRQAAAGRAGAELAGHAGASNNGAVSSAPAA